MIPTTLDAYRLIHEGAEALSAVEEAGIRMDAPFLDAKIIEVKEKIKALGDQLRSMDEFKHIQKRFGAQASVTSRRHLEHVLFEVQGHKPPAEDHPRDEDDDGEHKQSMKKTVLESIGTPYCKRFIEMQGLMKLESTYLRGFRREIDHAGFLHPVPNLHTVKTFRSSVDSPSFQNIPVRDGVLAEYIRSAFIPRDDHVLCEIDYGSLEFRGAACFWVDPNMVSYASDPKKDIHRDCAAEIYMTPQNLVSKLARYCGKNKFVFPELYGDYFINCAIALWEGIETHGLKVGDVEMVEWLRRQGITGRGACDPDRKALPGTFEQHVKEVEETFRGWFPHYAEEKERWWKKYCKNGYFDLMTGFRIPGVFSRNFLFNCPIQGPCFHLLLWSLIQMVKWTKQNKMKTVIVGQIHDSLLADVHRDELSDYIAKAKEVMTVDVRKHWDWIITPLSIEVEVASDNWFNKKAVAA